MDASQEGQQRPLQGRDVLPPTVRGYLIRPARTEDLKQLSELVLALQDHLEGSNQELWRMKADARAQLEGQLAARLNASQTCVLVAEQRDEGIVGVIFGRVATNTRYLPSRVGLVDQAYVLPEYRRAGVGTQLMAGLCHFFAEQDVDDLSLRYVIDNEEAARFWDALSFVPRIVIVGAARQEVESRVAQLQSL